MPGNCDIFTSNFVFTNAGGGGSGAQGSVGQQGTAGVAGSQGSQGTAGAGSQGAGSQGTQGTPNTGSNFSAVNEAVQDSDTTYVATNTNLDSYALSDLVSTPTTILGVQTNIIARADDGVTTHTVETSSQISGTNYFSPAFTTTYVVYNNLMVVSPASTVAWTAAEINAMQVGVKFIG